MASPSGRVRIADIAEQAGVSVPTVSRVLNGRDDVAAPTRARVEELLREHGLSAAPRRPRTVTGMVDVVFPGLDSPWALEVIRGVESAAREADLSTVVSASLREPAEARRWARRLAARTSAGVVLVASALPPDVLDQLRESGVPLAAVDPAGDLGDAVPTIGATNWAGGFAATDHLVSLGHRRIGLITGAPRLMCSRARWAGYRAALQAGGLPEDPRLEFQGDFDLESGLAGGQALLALDDRPTAIVACSDQTALGVYEAVRRHGLRVPDDVSVVGFDDLASARWASPPLTTVRQPLEAMGAEAVHVLLRLRAGQPASGLSLELATQLVIRESTRAPR